MRSRQVEVEVEVQHRCSQGGPLGGAGVHAVQAGVPEGPEAVVVVAAEGGEVLEQACGEALVPQRPGPPGLGQHGVVGPVEAGLLPPEPPPPDEAEFLRRRWPQGNFLLE